MKQKCKKGMALLLLMIMSVSTLWGCNRKTTTEKKGEEKQVLDEGAGENATELAYWTFVDLHGQHFSKMLGLWNKANPDRHIKLNVTVMPYDDMHNK